MKFLLSLVEFIVKLIEGRKEETNIRAGRALQNAETLQSNVNTLMSEAKAKNDAPTNKKELINRQREGKI